jgi:ABC-type uncharacterized transport system permease subunit
MRSLRLALGVGLIWAFLILFLVYPLAHLLRRGDRRGGRWTLANFHEFFTDRFTCARSGTR